MWKSCLCGVEARQHRNQTGSEWGESIVWDVMKAEIT